MTGAPGAAAHGGMFTALGHRDFRWWIAGLLISSIGTWMQMTAQDWTVLTVLTDHDAVALSVVIALQTAPQLLLLPVSGFVTDRYPRRIVLLATQTAMGLIAVAVGLLVLSGAAQYWHMCVFALMLGATQAFDGPARQTMVNDLVPQSALANGIALGAATFNLARLIGPAIAGLLIGAIGPGWIFIANGASFVAMIAALVVMRLDQVARASGRGAGFDVLGGIRYVVRHPRIRVLVVALFVVVGLVGSSLNLLVITTATQEFRAGAAGFGLLTSLIAVGSVSGALFAASRRRPRAAVFVGSTGVIGLALAIGAAMPTFVAFAVVLPVVGAALMVAMATCNALIQTLTEPEVRGRVMGIYMASWVSGATVGALVMGAIVDAWGPRAGLALGGLTCVLAAVGTALAVRAIPVPLTPETTAPAREVAPRDVEPAATGDLRGDLQ